MLRSPLLTCRLLMAAVSLLVLAARAEPDIFATYSNRVVRFENGGVLAGWTGANQKSKVTEATGEDHGGNGRSLLCLMNRHETDTSHGGCHAEVHLSRFADGTPLGFSPQFTVFTSHWVKFDTNCAALDVGFWQLKNHEGPQQWRYLAALWREARGGGDEIIFEVNPAGPDYNIYARLSRDGVPLLAPGRWNHVEVAGCYTTNATGWVQVRINGKLVTWYADRAGRQRIGTVWRGAALPDLAGAGWQFQVGGYGFFHRPGVEQGKVWVDDIRVETLAGPPARPSASTTRLAVGGH